MANGSYRTPYEPSTNLQSPIAPSNAEHSAWAASPGARRKPISIFVDNNLLRDVEVRLETSPDNVVSIHINRRQAPVVALPSAILPSELLGSVSRGGGLPSRSGLVALPSGRGAGGEATYFDTVSLIDGIKDRLQAAMRTLDAVVRATDHGQEGNARDEASGVLSALPSE
ncbi:hypothetical protein TW65_01009 [Stemphylium lycopersici]|nr:hypothetical protein TW65_01009 [Stemphylium lycopersici]